jgi:hypothetical protein
MSEGFLRRFEAELQGNAQLAAATRRMVTAIGTADWPTADRDFRATCFAAQGRALWRLLRGTTGATRLTQPAHSPLQRASAGG